MPPDALADGAAVVGEVFRAPVFADIEVEKGIVREEILEDLDEDGTDVNADNVSRAQVFAGHGLGMPITGSAANVDRFTVRHLRAHLDRHYGARNMVVAVASPLPHKAMLRAVSRAFGAQPSGARTATNVFKPSQSRARFKSVRYSGSQTSVRLAFPTAGMSSRAAQPLELLVRVLDDGMSTRLHRRICDERGLAYEVSAGVELFDDVGIVDVASSVAAGSVPGLVSEVLSILGDLAVDGPSTAEVERVHRRYAFDLDALEDESHALVDFYGAAELFHRRREPAERRREALSVTARDLRASARQAFDPSRLNVALVGNVDKAMRAAVMASVRAYRSRLRKATQRKVVAVSKPPRATPTSRRARVLDRAAASP
ncbi:MAG: insulinase family protein [Polyangiales bacterium]